MMLDLILICLALFTGLTLSCWILFQVGYTSCLQLGQRLTQTIERKLVSLYLFVEPRRILFSYLAVLLLLPLLLVLAGFSTFFVVIVILLLFALPALLFSLLEKRRCQHISAALPEALSQMAACMKSGATLNAAIEAQVAENRGPLTQELTLLLREQKLGMRMSEALDNLAERVQSDEMEMVITAALIAQEVGGNLSHIFQQLAETLQRQMEMDDKIRALTAQGKLQGWVVSMLPFCILLALYFIEPDAVIPVFSSLLGWIFLGMIVLLELMGGLMIRKIVSIDV